MGIIIVDGKITDEETGLTYYGPKVYSTKGQALMGMKGQPLTVMGPYTVRPTNLNRAMYPHIKSIIVKWGKNETNHRYI